MIEKKISEKKSTLPDLHYKSINPGFRLTKFRIMLQKIQLITRGNISTDIVLQIRPINNSVKSVHPMELVKSTGQQFKNAINEVVKGVEYVMPVEMTVRRACHDTCVTARSTTIKIKRPVRVYLLPVHVHAYMHTQICVFTRIRDCVRTGACSKHTSPPHNLIMLIRFMFHQCLYVAHTQHNIVEIQVFYKQHAIIMTEQRPNLIVATSPVISEKVTVYGSPYFLHNF